MDSLTILSLLAIAIAVRLLVYIASTLQHAYTSWKLGCHEAPLYPSRDPFGIATLLETRDAAMKKVFPGLWEKRIARLSELHDRYVSTFWVRQAGRRNLFTAEPKNIQAMLATQFHDYGLGDMRRNLAGPLVGHGIFTADGGEWSHSRTLLRPQFSRAQVSNLEAEERHVQNAMQAIPVSAEGWTSAVDIQTIFFRLTLDSATEFLFGTSSDSQNLATRDGLDKTSDSFYYRFDRCMWFLAERLRFERLYWIIDNKEFRKCVRMIHEFVDDYVHSALKRKTYSEKPTSTTDHPHQYVFLDALTNTTTDPLRLRDESLNVLLAGRDTTAGLLSWSMLVLSRNPAIFQKLRATILQEFGTYSNPQNITFTSLKDCKPLAHFLNETLRLYSVVPFNRRCALRDTTLPTGGGKDGKSPIFIPKGQSVLFSSYILHRRKDIWGPDADTFNPDRWIGRKGTWDFIPFNGGPRTCIGQQFALTNAGYVLVRLLQRFDVVEDVQAHREVRFGVNLTSCPADLLTVRMRRAEE